MFSILKNLTKIKNKNKNISDDKNNIMEKQNIIELGHYRLKSTLNSEVAKIIRIKRNDINNPDIWITSDGERISEYELINNYVFIETSYKENVPSVQSQIKFGDIPDELVDIPETPQLVNDNQYHEFIPIHNQNIVEKHTDNVKSISRLEDTIIDRCCYDYIDKQNSELYGTIYKTKRELLHFEWEFDINYDVEKLNTLIQSLSLDKTYIINTLSNKLLNGECLDHIKKGFVSELQKAFENVDNDVKTDIVKNIKVENKKPDISDQLEEDTFDEFENKMIAEQIPDEIPDEIPDVVSDILSDELSKLEEYLKNYEELNK